MPRPPRVEFEGALDHVITRGNNRQVIFRDEEDYHKFLTLERENQKHPFLRLRPEGQSRACGGGTADRSLASCNGC
jgi:hypothetical protein